MIKIKFFQNWLLKRPSAASIKGWRVWEETNKKNYPIKWLIQETFPDNFNKYFWWPISHRVSRIYWWIIHSYIRKHQYHIIRPRTLKPNYYDPRDRILHANFEILTAFVEKESGPDGHVDWGAIPTTKHVWKEAAELYDWWTKVYPYYDDEVDRKYPYPADPEGANWLWMFDDDYDDHPAKKLWCNVADVHNIEEMKQEKEIEEMLIRLMKIRPGLWY